MTRVPIKRRSINKRLDELIASFTPDIRAAFLSSMQDVRDSAILKELELSIEAGDVTRAFRSLGFNAAAMRPLSAMIERAFEAGGVTVAATAPLMRDAQGTRAVFRFDVRNSRAEAWLRDRSSTLVTRISQDTVEGLRTVLNTGMTVGTNPRTTALDIVGRINPVTGRREGGIVGLTQQQQGYVSRARAELASVDTASNWFTRQRRDKRFDSIVQKSIDSGVALDGATIQRLTSRYSDSLLQLRGETIARTESIAALNRSASEALQQAVDNGSIPKEAVKRVWDSAGPDGRTRDSHLTMDGQEVGLNEPFTAPDGSRMMFPGDASLGASPEETINCRCRVRVKVDWLGTADTGPVPAPVPEPKPAPRIPTIPTRAPTPIDPFVIPNARPTFAYENFQPLPTVAAAETWMRENIGRTVALTKGVKLDGLNVIANSIQEVNERFDLPPIRYIGDPKKDVVRWRDSRRATASFGMQHDAFLFKNVATDGDKQKEAAEYGRSQRVKQLELAKAATVGNRFVSDEVRTRLEKMDGYDWSVSPDPKRVTYHEMGHRFHSIDKIEIDNFLRTENPIRNGWGYLLSRYGATSGVEYVAESFSLYMNGDPREFYRIHPTLLDYFKKRDRARRD